MTRPRLTLRAFGDDSVLARPPVRAGTSVHTVLDGLDRLYPAHCGGSTICGTCAVVVLQGADTLPEAAPDERLLLETYHPHEPRARLACRLSMPEGDVELVLTHADWRKGS